jgi:hypothetical protein
MFNPFFEAIHVVPKTHTKDKANMGNPTEFILVENAFNFSFHFINLFL